MHSDLNSAYETAVALIDIPPALSASIERVIPSADLVLILARSTDDLRAVAVSGA